jgi:hypothetical protein
LEISPDGGHRLLHRARELKRVATSRIRLPRFKIV